MDEKTGINGKFRILLFMPSFYGLLTFPFFYFLYLINIFPYEEKNLEAQIICIAVVLFFISSIFFNFSNYSFLIKNRYVIKKEELRDHLPFTNTVLLLFFLIGVIGSIKYILDFSSFFGGVWLFFFLLLNDSGQIRIAQETQASVGFQLSYFAWLSISMFVLNVRLKVLNGFYILLGMIAFVLNLFFIDRTRPLTILFTTLLILFFVSFDRFTSTSLKRIFLITGIMLVSVFVIIGEWIGKVAQDGEYGETFIPPVFQTAVLYGSSSFGYFNRIVENGENGDFTPLRSLYPAQKLFSAFKITKEPPAQINEFYYIPQPTNVGTFLEPLYRDGGIWFCLVGILLHSFLFDLAGMFFLKYINHFSLYALAVLCFINFFAFFSPKFNVLPVWIFIFFGAIGAVVIKSREAQSK